MSKKWSAAIGPSEQTTTISGFIAGTHAYMSPERLLKRSYEGRSDLFSIGVIMYRMLNGKMPFQSDDGSNFEQIMAQLMNEALPLTAFNANLPDGLDQLVRRLLAKDPEDRPASKELPALTKACV